LRRAPDTPRGFCIKNDFKLGQRGVRRFWANVGARKCRCYVIRMKDLVSACSIDNLDHPTATGQLDWERAHVELLELARNQAALDTQIGRWLLYASRAATHAWLGYASIGEYAGRLFGFTRRQTQERLRVAEALEQLPTLASALELGQLCWSAVRELTRVATPETEAEWVAAAHGRSAHQVEAMVAGHARGDQPRDPANSANLRRVLRFELSAEAYATVQEALTLTRRRTGGRLDDEQALLMMSRQVLGGPSDDGRSSYQIAISVCPSCERGFQHARGELVELGAAAMEKARCDAQDIGSVRDYGTHVGRERRVGRDASSITAGMRSEARGLAGHAAGVTAGAEARAGAAHADAPDAGADVGAAAAPDADADMGAAAAPDSDADMGAAAAPDSDADMSAAAAAPGAEADVGAAVAPDADAVVAAAAPDADAAAAPDAAAGACADAAGACADAAGACADAAGACADAEADVSAADAGAAENASADTGASAKTGAGAGMRGKAVTRLRAKPLTHDGAVQSRAPATSRATQTIPPRIRRLVLRRAQHRCEVSGCTSSTFLDVHHRTLRSEGGGHHPNGLVVLCAAHHTAVHDGRLLIEGDAVSGWTFRHADGTVYGGAPRVPQIDVAVKVFRGLCTLGFKHRDARRAVDDAVREMKTRVGADISCESVLRESLRMLTPGTKTPKRTC
jgi:hypothetical protein